MLDQNRRGVEQQLAGLRLTLQEAPTNGGLLILGRDPQRWVPGAWAQFLRIDGQSLTDPIRDQKTLTGRLEDVLRRIDELLELTIAVRTDVTSATREIRSPDYPLVALQQLYPFRACGLRTEGLRQTSQIFLRSGSGKRLYPFRACGLRTEGLRQTSQILLRSGSGKRLVRNAIMHRSYEGTNAPVRVYWYADRVEIQSPGGLYGRLTAQNFGLGITDYRNPLIAEAMYHLGFTQRFGLGIPLAREALQNNGNPPPEFDFQLTAINVTVRTAS